MYTSLFLLCIQCIQVLFVYSDATERATRGLSMLRMGKRNLNFRLGRSFSLPPLVPPSYDLPEDDMEERELMGSPRMGKHLADYDFPRFETERDTPPSYPRLGALDEYVNEIRRALASPDDEIRQIYASIPRAGRYLGRQKRSIIDEQTVDEGQEEQVDESSPVQKEKRALPRFGLRETENNPFPRLGLYDRDIPFPRLGLYERAAFPRFGLRDENEDENSLADPDNEINADERALPRFGLREVDNNKRAVSMLRMGKRDDEMTNEKRAMSMLRMGKRGMSMLRMGKRGVSMLRMGRSQPMEGGDQETAEKRAVSMLRMGRSLGADNSDATTGEQKRAMSMLRMGKRGHMSMLRMGRSYNAADDESAKRAMSMLRMGRGMSMLRMGRSSPENQQEADEQKRAMSMLRMGRGMSMLRMGKRSVDEAENSSTVDDSKTSVAEAES